MVKDLMLQVANGVPGQTGGKKNKAGVLESIFTNLKQSQDKKTIVSSVNQLKKSKFDQLFQTQIATNITGESKTQASTGATTKTKKQVKGDKCSPENDGVNTAVAEVQDSKAVQAQATAVKETEVDVDVPEIDLVDAETGTSNKGNQLVKNTKPTSKRSQPEQENKASYNTDSTSEENYSGGEIKGENQVIESGSEKAQITDTVKANKFEKSPENATSANQKPGISIEDTQAGPEATAETGAEDKSSADKTLEVIAKLEKPAVQEVKAEANQQINNAFENVQVTVNSTSNVIEPAAMHKDTATVSAEKAVEQIETAASTAYSKQGQKITINLDPPELGRVKIEFRQEGGEVIGRLEIERPAVRDQIESSIGKVVQNLNDSGCQVKNIEVVRSDFGNTSNNTDSSNYRSWQGTSDSNNQNNPNEANTGARADKMQYSFSNPTEKQDWSFSDKSVNVLA